MPRANAKAPNNVTSGKAAKQIKAPATPRTSRPSITGPLSSKAVVTAAKMQMQRLIAAAGINNHRKMLQNLVSVFGIGNITCNVTKLLKHNCRFVN